MRKGLFLPLTLLLTVFFSFAAIAQNFNVTGTVRMAGSSDGLPSISVALKDGTSGSVSDALGNFRISVPKFPAVLVFTSVGFELKEVTVENTNPIVVELNPAALLGQEVVVAATRTPTRILESPVTIERMSSAILRNVPAPNYYEAITNLKGVDMHTASLTFRTVTTRGFLGSGNTRLNQLVDGMDNQAPGLNFSVGSVIGLTEMDVDNIELLSGASSALYGSGGMNGTLLINSKNPFRYEGFSYQIKQGVNHIKDKEKSPSPFYDWSFRYAKSFKDKFAFKVTSQFIKASDWQATDYSNVERTSILSKLKAGDRTTDPNYDGVNMYGDETSANLFSTAQAVQAGTRAGLLGATGGQFDVIPFLNQLPANATSAQIAALLGALPASLQPLIPTIQNVIPFYFGLRNNLIPNQNASRTGYEEKSLVDYNSINYKITGGIFYKITPKIEASFNSYFGTGTTVYTGADRYALRNLKIAQHKLEFRSDKWLLRGYTTQENAGDSYNATVLGRLINEAWKPSTTWYPQYVGTYAGARLQGASDFAAHQAARAAADQGRLLPGTQPFADAANSIKRLAIPKGAKFLDKTDLYSAEGQLNISDVLAFTDKVEMIAGAQWKRFVLNSQGTIFADTAEHFKPTEYGMYAQLRKNFLGDILTLTAAGRYDKHTNFKGRFTPRVTARIKVAKDNNIRLSYQTAYRFPTNQDQYINLNVGSGLLIGSLPVFQTYYHLNSNPGYTAESVDQYRKTGNAGGLMVQNYKEIKPESVSSYEIGYKGLLSNRFFFDGYAYYSKYQNFLGRTALAQPRSIATRDADLLNPQTSVNYSYNANSTAKVKALGWGVSAEYQLPRKYIAYANLFSDKLKDVPANFVTFFNAPKYRYNLGMRNENVYKNVGFNVVLKHQDKNFYEGTFVTGLLPAFTTVDAQVSYKVPDTKSSFRIGGTNVTNHYYRSGYGSPSVGGLYYVSYGYNLF
ncbi:MAG: TonB-dependent receptor [Chitinophagaceae bacterium]